jgi:hypothetical protein
MSVWCRIVFFCWVILAALPISAQAAKPASFVIHAAFSLSSQLPVEMPGPYLSPPGNIVRAALTYLGVPYVTGGESRKGLDCSGLIARVYRDEAGLDLPRGVEALFRAGLPVSHSLHTGDLLFFDTTNNGSPSVATHVGVYAGADTFVHAASAGSHTGVIVSALRNPYYRNRFLGARRVVQWRAPVLSVTLSDTHKTLIQASPFASQETMQIRVFNGMTGGGPVDLTLLKNGRRVLTTRICPGPEKPSEVTLTPEPGQWTLQVSRIFKGRELQNVTFTVEE